MVVPLEAFPRLEEDGKARRDLEKRAETRLSI